MEWEGGLMRASEFFKYINLEKHPLPSEIQFYFSHIKVDEKLKKVRKEYCEENKSK